MKYGNKLLGCPRALWWVLSNFESTQYLSAQFLNITKINYHIYADGTQIYCAFEINSLNEILASICDCIADIRYWMIKNKFKINDDKTEFLLITSPSAKLTRDIKISFGKDQISRSHSCKSLGVMFDQHLSVGLRLKASAILFTFTLGTSAPYDTF